MDTKTLVAIVVTVVVIGLVLICCLVAFICQHRHKRERNSITKVRDDFDDTSRQTSGLDAKTNASSFPLRSSSDMGGAEMTQAKQANGKAGDQRKPLDMEDLENSEDIVDLELREMDN